MIQPVSRTTYVPHIDGLRAVAVLSVMVYHLDKAWLPGGFSGVDIFFVISGFVVSASLAEFRKSTPLAFFAYFYARRILRIVPALVACLIVTHIAAMLFIPRAWASHANEETGLYAFFGLSNFVLARAGNDYFSPTSEFNPYTHTWSLGVEEQFYLIFPPLFAAWIAGGQWRRVSALLFGVGLVASLACAAWLTPNIGSGAFYMLYCRFWELAGGVLLYQLLVVRGHAFSESDRPMTWRAHVVAIASAAVVGYGCFISRPATFPYPGAIGPVIGTLGLLAALHGRGPGGPVMQVLRNPVVVFIGQISYSLYLWHWPVFVVFRWTAGLESTTARVAAVVITFTLATASYFLIERPPRRAARVRTAPRLAVIAAGAAIVATSALLTTQLQAHATQWALSQVTRHPNDWYAGRLDDIGARNCRLQAHNETVGDSNVAVWAGVGCTNAPASAPRLFVIGDSHAEAYTTMLPLYAMDMGVEVYKYANGGCPFLSLQLEREGGECPADTAASIADMQRRIRGGDVLFLPSLRLNRFSDQTFARNEVAARQAMVGPAADRARSRAVEEAIEALRPFVERGVRVVFEAPKPLFRVPTFRCVDWFNAGNPVCAPGLEMQRDELMRYREPVVTALATIARRVPGVSVWDPFPLLCPGKACGAMRGDDPLFFDGDHLTAYANRMLLPHFENWIANPARRATQRGTTAAQ
ncbi:MAG TPA: acyltransferase family protein [Rhodanobacteraceae bacterium]|nr:acyltransferase family protein [Rhodanobacteraceae bacterium]